MGTELLEWRLEIGRCQDTDDPEWRPGQKESNSHQEEQLTARQSGLGAGVFSAGRQTPCSDPFVVGRHIEAYCWMICNHNRLLFGAMWMEMNAFLVKGFGSYWRGQISGVFGSCCAWTFQVVQNWGCGGAASWCWLGGYHSVRVMFVAVVQLTTTKFTLGQVRAHNNCWHHPAAHKEDIPSDQYIHSCSKVMGFFFCGGKIWCLFLRYRPEILCVA